MAEPLSTPAAGRTRYLKRTGLAEAQALLLGSVEPGPTHTERIAAEASSGRITAAAVFARLSSPHYHGAAMDGIALRAADTFGASETTPVVVAPTAPDTGTPPPRAFAYVDTGQPLPPWADAVVMIERVFPASGGAVAIHAAAAPWQHVRLVGEDVVATEPLLPRGHRIRPYDVGALLAAGVTVVDVAARPRVAIIPTGTELVEPGGEPPPGRIIEFNSRVMAASIEEWGGTAERRPAVADDPAQLQEAIRQARAAADVVAVIAGSSAGAHDFTAAAVRDVGRLLVHGIDIMPGKPAIVGVVEGTPVLGIPGYPVSAVIVCQQLLRPLLARLLGTRPEAPATVRAIVPRKLPSRLGLEEFVRVSVGRVGDRLVVNPLGRGAGVITSMVKADGFVRIPSLSEGINAGAETTVELLRPLDDIEHTILFTGSHDLTIGILEDTLKAARPELRIATSNVGSLAGLTALRRREAHLAGSHLLDPRTGSYNLPDVRRLLPRAKVRVVTLVRREQGLLVAPGNPKGIRGLKDLARPDVTFVNRQPGAGTRVLLDHRLRKLRLDPRRIRGYEREEFTHMAVAVAVRSGLADVALGIKSAAAALGLDFVPVEVEDYDLVLLREFAAGEIGRTLLDVVRSDAFRAAVAALPGYDTSVTGREKRP
jgi:putative molybdopterin biosynthesis protein